MQVGCGAVDLRRVVRDDARVPPPELTWVRVRVRARVGVGIRVGISVGAWARVGFRVRVSRVSFLFPTLTLNLTLT